MHDNIADKVSFNLSPPKWLHAAMKSPHIRLLEHGDIYTTVLDIMQPVRGITRLELKDETDDKTRKTHSIQGQAI